MDAWHVAHLVALAMWGGLVAAEAVVELSPRTDAERRSAAILHYRMDLLVEAPLLAGVLVTGAVLAARAWPLSALLEVKIGAGLVAVAANLWCIVHVVARKRRVEDAEHVARQARWVQRTAAVGVPFAAVATYLGFAYFVQ